ncbi:uncharacterized protein LOC127835266 isoform X2 [Dreissena polymorpha]|uniref:ADP-ribosylglycohydrolase n=1 Tax=Dreissena polymorpha TaxID=45954 RepID=A0A9D4JLM6_DREPO|nr:uncharacterized protein LOC127835266 isoform X2 [Dreissena polymorpha]KAH3811912.1 hypothetical protein DPMN_140329 [Dreissena polymorpha]
MIASEISTRNLCSAMIKMTEKVIKAREAAIWGMLAADAVAMPVHWYYNPRDIYAGYGGWLTGFVAPNKKHPSSILTLSAVDGSGRTGWNPKSQAVVGNVILHDKLKFWQSNDRSIHYHQGMKAGENTLNAVTAMEFLKTMQRVDPEATKSEEEVRGAVLEGYVKFMTTPGSHNDTYAESFHRSFFKDWASADEKYTTAKDLLKFTENRYKEKTKGKSDSQLVVIGALVPALPWILRNSHKSENDCARSTIDFIKCTHPERALTPFIDIYARLLHAVINGRDLKQEVLQALSHSELGGPRKREIVLRYAENAAAHPAGSTGRLEEYQSAVSDLGMACYIEGALSSMLMLAYAFADDFEGGILMNANCGGENCHRGAALGALLGAHAANKGRDIPQKYKDRLYFKDSVMDLLQQMNNSSKM